jgi:peptide/nickel transport system permease protein
MLGELRSRLLWAVPSFIAITFLIFVVMNVQPGDPAAAIAGPEASPQILSKIRTELHLDEPVVTQYGRWLGGVVHGDLGTSLVNRESVGTQVMDAVPATLSLLLVSTVFACIGALLLGGVPAIWRHPVVDRTASFSTAVLLAMPPFWLALLLVSAFALDRSWLPAVGYVPFIEDPWQWFLHLLLPALTLGAVLAGELGRQLRGSLRDALDSDYVIAARARGISYRRVVGKHASKNALIPVVTVLGARVAALMGGTVIVEQIFIINGLGRLAVNGAVSRDMPVVLGVVVVASVMVLVINLLVDLSYGYLNPKLRKP